MMKRLLLFVLVLSTIFFTSCSTENEDIRGIVNTLTSPQCEGRLVGTAGNEKAADYIAAFFNKNDIEPLFGNGYDQNYKQDVANPAEQHTKIVIYNNDGSQYNLQYGRDFIVSTVAEDIHIQQPLTFDLSKAGSKDEILVFSAKDSNPNTAKGVAIFKSNDTIRHAPRIPLVGDCLIVDITNQVKDKLSKDQAISAEITCMASKHEYDARNVVGGILGKTGTQKAVVLTAHFDHAGRQGDYFFPGALDNASGVAAMLETAKLLKSRISANELDMDIVFAAVNSEECGSSDGKVHFPGSKALVDELSKKYGEIYNINIDCVGGKLAGPLALKALGSDSSNLTDLMQSAMKEHGIEYEDVDYGASDFVATQSEKVFQSMEAKERDQQDNYFDSDQWWEDAKAERGSSTGKHLRMTRASISSLTITCCKPRAFVLLRI